MQTHTLTISNPGDMALNWTMSQESSASLVTLDVTDEHPATPTPFHTTVSFAPFRRAVWLLCPMRPNG